MANMIGMDVEEVRGLARTLDAKAGDIDQIISTVESQLGTTTWVGTDADRFRNDWDTRLKVDLRRVAEALRTAAMTANKNADMQANTSSQL